jgi:glycosyltransferase involved in cell wall biosynthesis
MRKLRILGTRGIPATHGGFETFAERLALHLVEHNWRVVVYCQIRGTGPITLDNWNGVERVLIPISADGPKGTILFDWHATCHAAGYRDLCLTLGYNTALFCTLLRLRGIRNIINMDGIEWRRAKWGRIAKAWFWINDWLGCWLGNHLIADNPHIQTHLATRVSTHKISTIPYGADAVENAPTELLKTMGLTPGNYLILIARPEPENLTLEIVQSYSLCRLEMPLVVVGNFDSENRYHQAVKDCAGPNVQFVGAIYDKPMINSLRFHSAAYIHGHQVGGTNPSLVEAMGAGNAVIAHDNRFNRWVVGDGAMYFKDANGLSECLRHIVRQPECLVTLGLQARQRFEQKLTWPHVLEKYESLLTKWSH